MLKSNSKRARANIRKYIIDHFSDDNYYDKVRERNWTEVSNYIEAKFNDERWHDMNERRYFGYDKGKAFEDWCAGLPSVIDTCYYYNRSACDDLAEILEETPEEAERFSKNESRAEHLLTYMIFREIFEKT